MGRELFAGPEKGPESPFPIQLSGRIIKGFGRGSKQLGIPTANIPISGLDVGGHTDIDSGIYYGFAGLSVASATSNPSNAAGDHEVQSQPQHHSTHNSKDKSLSISPEDDVVVYPMVMSIGWNPYYKNEVRSVEVHIIHEFAADFYDGLLNLSILGFIRQEKDYESMDALITDIRTDIDVARRSLERAAYVPYAKDQFLTSFDWLKKESSPVS